MSRSEGVIFCDGCGVEITWGPLVEGSCDYCCLDCLQGLPCRCGERMEIENDRRGSGEQQQPHLEGQVSA